MKKGWEYKKLGEVGTFKRGGNFSKKDFIENGFPCIHYGQIHMKFGIETFKHLSSVPAEMVKPDRCAQKGDLVIAVTSEDDAGSCKCTAWMGDYEAYVGGHAAIYRHTMEPKYVSYYFMSPYFQKAKLEYTHGFKVVEINPKDIANISIPIPPLSEQKEIVEYLDSSFAKIDKLKENAAKNLEEAKALFQSALKDALEPKEGWEEKKLKEVANYRRGSFPQPYGNSEWYDGEDSMPFVQVAELQEDSFALIMPTKKRISKLAQPLSVFVPEGIVLVSLQGSIGKVGITQNNCYVDRTVAIFQSYKLPVDSHFFAYQLKERFAIERLKARGTTIKTITKEEFANFTIMLPPLSEQQSIVSFLDSLNEKVNTLQQNYSRICDECDALKQAILRQVFE